MARKKSSGMDGILNEFYQRSWDWIKDDLLEVVRHSLEQGELGEDLNQSLIILLPKKSNPMGVGDYMPISFLGGIYKITAKIWASRIQHLVPKLVHSAQMGLVAGRSLSEAMLSTWAGIEEGSELGSYILLKVNFEKVYNKLEWRFVVACLEKMNFGVGLLRGLKHLFMERMPR